MIKRNLNKNAIFLISSSLVLVDQITKNIAMGVDYNRSFILIPKLVKFNLTTNSGAAFSIFSNFPNILSIISLIVTFILIILICRRNTFVLHKGLFIGFLLGGTIGNGIDRWRFGYVIDFIQIIPFDFPIFNIADISINIALFFLLIDSIPFNNKSKKNKMLKTADR